MPFFSTLLRRLPLTSYILTLSLLASSPLSAQNIGGAPGGDGGNNAKPLSVLIGIRTPEADELMSQEAMQAQVAQQVTDLGGSVSRSYHLIPAIAAEVPAASLPILRAHPNVSIVEQDREVKAVAQTVPYGIPKIRADLTQTQGFEGEGIKVAVIDSGIDLDHPDLIDNLYVNTAEAEGTPGVDDDGNGYIDDIHGWNFVSDNNDPDDDNSHGTHCAGTIGAANNDIGVIGVAPKVQLVALKVLGASGSGSYSWVISALEYCVDNDLDLTSNSYGSSGSPGSLVEAAFNAAEDAGILNIAAAGNSGAGDNTVIYPARYQSTVAVAATNQDDLRASFSSTGPAVEVAAPGVRVYSTTPNGLYGYKSGTSMACPHAAGAAAVLLGSGMTPDEAREALRRTALDLGDPGVDHSFGFGRIDVYLALNRKVIAFEDFQAVNMIPFDLAENAALGDNSDYSQSIPGWTIDNDGFWVPTDLMYTRSAERAYDGWSVIDAQSWQDQQNFEFRTFLLGNDFPARNAILVADSDAHDDFDPAGSLPPSDPNAEREFNSYVYRTFDVGYFKNSTLSLTMDWEFRRKDNARGSIDASFNGGKSWTRVLDLDSTALAVNDDDFLEQKGYYLVEDPPGSGNFVALQDHYSTWQRPQAWQFGNKDNVNNGDADFAAISSNTIILRLGLTESTDDWWFAADNIRLEGFSQPYKAGDANLDGSLGIYDINPFLLALNSPAEYEATYGVSPYIHLDFNFDGAIDIFDINNFLNALNGN